MSKPSPERFDNFWWAIGDVIGWITDLDPEKFGRIATVADLPPPVFQPDPNLRERAPEIRLLRALERGDLVVYDPSNGKPVSARFWRFKNEGDIRALFGRGFSFGRDDVLRLWPGPCDAAQSGTGSAESVSDGEQADMVPRSEQEHSAELVTAPSVEPEIEPESAATGTTDGVATGPEFIEQLAEWIFARRTPRLTFDQLFAAAGRDIKLGSFKKVDFLTAYRCVFKTSPHRPPATGWPLRTPYKERMLQEKVNKS